MLGEQGRCVVAESFIRPIPERQGGSPFNLSAATVGSQCVAWHAQRDEFCLAEIEQIGGGDTAIIKLSVSKEVEEVPLVYLRRAASRRRENSILQRESPEELARRKIVTLESGQQNTRQR